MTLDEAVEALEEMGGIIRDHFTFPMHPSYAHSIRVHGNAYVDREKIYVDPEILTTFAREIAESVLTQPIDTVVSDKNGQVLSYAVARWIGELRGHGAFSMVANKKRHGVFDFNPDLFAKYVSGKRILIVEDIISSAISLRGIKKVVGKKSPKTLKMGQLIGVAAIFNERGMTARDIGISNLYCLLEFDSWHPDECELCRRGVPLRGDVRLDRGITYHRL